VKISKGESHRCDFIRLSSRLVDSDSESGEYKGCFNILTAIMEL
jgi:hypothetical protein